VGRLVAERMRVQPVPFVQVDRVFDLLLPASYRTRSDRLLGYEASHALVRTILDNGRDCIIECTYARRDQRTSLRSALAGLYTSPLRVAEISVSAEEAVARFRGRRAATDLDESSLRERVVNYPFWDGALQLESGVAAPEEMARQVAGWLERSPEPVDVDAWTQAGRAWT
jgi:predicted kinase